MSSRLISLIRKEFIQLFRDKRLLALILVIPWCRCSCWATPPPTMCATCPWRSSTRATAPEGRDLLDAYQAADYFKLAYSVNSEAELQQLIEKGQARSG